MIPKNNNSQAIIEIDKVSLITASYKIVYAILNFIILDFCDYFKVITETAIKM
jgi:hypothetical protein